MQFLLCEIVKVYKKINPFANYLQTGLLESISRWPTKSRHWEIFVQFLKS